MDDAILSTDENGIEVVTGDEDEVLSAVGRVRSVSSVNDHRYAPY
jgi:hypothetical protein